MTQPTKKPPDEICKVDDSTVRRFLELSLSPPRRPVDDLIERLEKPDGEDFFYAVLEKGPPAVFGCAKAHLLRGEGTLAQFVEIKQKSKKLLQRDQERDLQLAGMFGYFFAVAAALVHHRTQISRRLREDLEGVLLDLASAVPDPWSDLLAEAASRVGRD